MVIHLISAHGLVYGNRSGRHVWVTDSKADKYYSLHPHDIWPCFSGSGRMNAVQISVLSLRGRREEFWTMDAEHAEPAEVDHSRRYWYWRIPKCDLVELGREPQLSLLTPDR
jgi:hypothetical protein